MSTVQREALKICPRLSVGTAPLRAKLWKNESGMGGWVDGRKGDQLGGCHVLHFRILWDRNTRSLTH